jgi:hypothetical protein
VIEGGVHEVREGDGTVAADAGGEDFSEWGHASGLSCWGLRVNISQR